MDPNANANQQQDRNIHQGSTTVNQTKGLEVLREASKEERREILRAVMTGYQGGTQQGNLADAPSRAKEKSREFIYKSFPSWLTAGIDLESLTPFNDVGTSQR